jgi:hypothetical protein
VRVWLCPTSGLLKLYVHLQRGRKVVRYGLCGEGLHRPTVQHTGTAGRICFVKSDYKVKEFGGRAWTGLIWLRIRANRTLLWRRYWTFGFHKWGQFRDYLGNCQRLKKISAAWLVGWLVSWLVGWLVGSELVRSVRTQSRHNRLQKHPLFVHVFRKSPHSSHSGSTKYGASGGACYLVCFAHWNIQVVKSSF